MLRASRRLECGEETTASEQRPRVLKFVPAKNFPRCVLIYET